MPAAGNEAGKVSKSKGGGRRLLRWGVRGVGIGAVVLVGGWVALHLAVRAAVKSVAEGMGVKDLRFAVRQVSLSRVVLGEIAVGKTGPRLAEASAEFSLVELLSGKVKSVRLSGLEATVDVSTGELRVEGIAISAGGSTGSGSTQPAKVGISLDSLPSKVEVSASVVKVKLGNGAEVAVPVGLSYVRTAKGADLMGSVQVGMDRLELVGLAPNAEVVQAKVKGAISVGTVLPLLPVRLLPEGVTATGRAEVEVNTTVMMSNLAASTATFRVDVDRGSARIPTAVETLDLTGLTVEATGDYGSGAGKVTANVGGTIKALWLDGPTKLLVKTSASYSEGDGVSCNGSAFASGPVVSAEVTAFKFRRSAKGEMVGGAEYRASVRPPKMALEMLQDQAMVVDGAAAVTFSGEATLIGLEQLAVKVRDVAGAVRSVGIVGGEGVRDVRFGLATADLTVRFGEGRVDGLASGLSITAAGVTGLPDIKLKYSDKPFAVTVPNVAGRVVSGGGYEVSLPTFSLEIPETGVSTGEAQLNGVAGVLKMTGEVSGEQVTVKVLDDSHLRLESAKGRDDRWATGQLRFTLAERVRPTTQPSSNPASTRPTGPVPLFSYSRTKGAYAALRAEAKDARGSSQGIEVAAPRVVANVEAGLSGEVISLDGYVRVENTDVNVPVAGVTVHGLDIRLPFSLDATTPPNGRFTTTSVERNGQSLPAITGEVWVTRKAAYLGLDWPIVPEGTVKASASVDFLPGKTVADIRAWVPEFDFKASEALRRLLPPGLADLDVTGKFAAELRYVIDGPTVYQWGAIDVKDASIRSKALDADLTGVSGQVWTRSLSPLETPPGQSVKVRSAKLGNLKVSEGSIEFRLDPGNLIFVESAGFGFAGGVLTARGFRVDPIRSATDLTLYADKLDVGQLAETLAPGKVSGMGKMYARLPVSVEWPKRVTLHDGGYIYAAATGPNLSNPEHVNASGVLNLGPYGETIGSWVGVSPNDPMGQPSTNPQEIKADVSRRVVAALSDFGFTTLSLDLNRKSATDPLVATLRTNGVGTQKTGGQVLDLTFNFSGLEAAFNLYLGFNDFMDRIGK